MVTPVVQQSALVLNQNYEPLNVCSVRRAFVLVFRGKAELLAEGDEPIHGVDAVRFTSPSVIRLRDFVRRPLPHVRLTRREVFARDNNRCQYCNRQDGDLTLDHVIPRRLGGRHEWENLVAACRGCNHRKGGRTPSEARMRLRRKPLRPVATAFCGRECVPTDTASQADACSGLPWSRDGKRLTASPTAWRC